jgi:hypothetical protein
MLRSLEKAEQFKLDSITSVPKSTQTIKTSLPSGTKHHENLQQIP